MVRRGAALRNIGEDVARQPETNPKKNASRSGLAEAMLPETVLPEVLALERQLSESWERPVSVVLAEVVEKICALTGADGAAIALSDNGQLICCASAGDAPSVGSRLQSEAGLTRECFETGQVVVCEDAESDSRVPGWLAQSLRLRSLVAVPIESYGKVLGIVEVLSSRPSAFGASQVDSLQRVSDSLAARCVPPAQIAERRTRRPWILVAAVVALLLASLVLLFLFELQKRPRTASTPVPSSTGAQQQPSPGALQTQPNQAPPVSRAPSATAPSQATEQRLARSEIPELRSAPKVRSVPGSGSARPSVAAPAASPTVANNTGVVGASPSQPSGIGAAPEPKPLDLTELAQSKASVPELTAVLTPFVRSRELTTPQFVLERTVKDRAAGWVTSVAFSADGQHLAAGGSEQKSVKLWDVPTGQELGTVGGEIKGVQALTFSRDGHWLAAESSSNEVMLWDAATRRQVWKLATGKALPPLGKNWVYSIAFSPDGRWLASGVDEKTVRLWDVTSGRAIRDLATEQRSVIYTAFSPDGRLVASGGDGKTIKIWEAATGKELQTLRGHKGDVYAVAFSPDGRWLASASADKTVKIWDLSTGREFHTLTGHRNWVTSLAFSPDGRWLASGSWDNTVKIWDVGSGSEVQTLAGHAHHVYTVAFDTRGRWVASGSEDGSIKLWRLDASRSKWK